jgi:hypothetical protein
MTSFGSLLADLNLRDLLIKVVSSKKHKAANICGVGVKDKEVVV